MKSDFGYLTVEENIRLRFGMFPSKTPSTVGTIILLGGRTEFIEKYFETIEELNLLGFDVSSFDWRGQGLSTRLLKNRRKGYIDNYESYLRDLSAFMKNKVLPDAKRPLVLMAHSMGGHIGLRFLHDNPGIVDRAVLLCPMFDIRIFCLFKEFAIKSTRLMTAAGYGKAYAAGGDGLMEDRFEGNSLTSDPIRFHKTIRLVEKNPDLAIGGVTFRWLHESFLSIDLLKKTEYIQSIRTPILILGGSKDRVVCNDSHRQICQRLENCHYTVIPDSRHEILQEKDKIRQKFWDVFTSFTRPILPK